MKKSELFWTDPKTGRPWDIEFTWRRVAGRSECVGVKIVASDLPRERPRVVTGKLMRDLPWGRIIKQGRAEALRGLRAFAAEQRDHGDPDRARAAETFALGLRQKGKAGGRPRMYGDDHYRSVAGVYADAHELGDPPTKAVEQTFTTTHSTAARWVSECRRRGFLNATEFGVAGGLLPTADDANEEDS